MSTTKPEAASKDSVKILGRVLFPVVCVALSFGANALGLFNDVFPHAGWGLLTMMGLGLWSAFMVSKALLVAAAGGPAGEWERSEPNPF